MNTKINKNLLRNFKKFDKYKKIFGFINENMNHWTCFLVDSDNSVIFYLDPYGEKDINKNKLVNNWSKYSKTFSFFSQRKWRTELIKHPIQKDSINCGVYVSFFLKFLLNGREVEFEDSIDDLKKLRIEMNFTLKKNSVKNFCSFCGEAFKIDEKILKSDCFHRYHFECAIVKLKSKKNFFCPLCG